MALISALAMACAADGWRGQDVELDDVADLDAVTELLRDVAEEGTVVLFLEEDDEYVAVVRLDGDDDPRVFLSDRRVVDQSALAARLFEDVLPVVEPALEGDDEDDEQTARPEGEPAGDPDLLRDLGTPAHDLLALCVQEGMLPADVIYALCERAGCVDVLEELRVG